MASFSFDSKTLLQIGLGAVVLWFLWTSVLKDLVCHSSPKSTREPFAPYPLTYKQTLLDRKTNADSPYPYSPDMQLRSLDTPLGEKINVKKEDWAALAPPDADLKERQFLAPEKFIGIDTVGSSLKNANYDIRSAPPCPKLNVGPWNNSTVTADPWRRPLE
jgi:hypothetical protein